MTKRTIYIDGLKLGFKHGADLLNLINDKLNYHSKNDVKPEINLVAISKALKEYLSQWDNIELGDQVNYRGGK